MSRRVRLNVDPSVASDSNRLRKVAASSAGYNHREVSFIRIVRRSVDARRGRIRINLEIEIGTGKEKPTQQLRKFRSRDVSLLPEVIIVGSGPAGLFAALRLIELGLRPVILERGNDVTERKRDIARLSREHTVDSDSNYCFGEGGAGTYSDGKLYTRSKKRGDNTSVLELLNEFGADESILYEAHPHIGTDRLPGIIKNIREAIVDCGAVFLMKKRVDGIIIDGGSVHGVQVGEESFRSENVILATGHSARDIYLLLDKMGVAMESKPFAMGVRVEHPQELIDTIQYHGKGRGDYLPSATYSLSHQVNGRGVFSFCMCPGGFIVPSATAPGEVVVNGMSPSHRNSFWANSGIVAEIRESDLKGFGDHRALAGLKFQQQLESRAWIEGGRSQVAPAERLTDFIEGRVSQNLPRCSYAPGITVSPLHDWLPEVVGITLRRGFEAFGRIMKGFITSEAVVVGVESRSSSPVRIPRDAERLEHIHVGGLYPCGEGSGYAGGIVSSAVDGIRVAEKIAEKRGFSIPPCKV